MTARYDASRHFTATPDGHGGVRLKLRGKFRDIMGSYLDPDGTSDDSPIRFPDDIPELDPYSGDDTYNVCSTI